MEERNDGVVLRVEGLGKTFGHGSTAVRAVDGVDMEAREGEIVLIMGPSGSGKTTLLTMIGGLLRPDAGRVFIDGLELTALPHKELPAVRRERVGFVFQTFNLLEALTAAENVELPLNMAGVSGREARTRAVALLEERDMGHRLSFRPNQLSGGEKQRVSIARALANQPRLILADEPTANLDSKHGHDTLLHLRAVAKEQGRTVIIVSHDHRIREIADRVLWLEDGRFKDVSLLATDPVCGMQVEVDSARATIERDGRTYYFCSRGCSWEFQKDHASFAGASD
jgi:putative ABC transport system ATP-binding protein